MRIPKLKAKLVKFHGFDGKTYSAVTCGVRNNVLTLRYTVPGLPEMCTAYLPRENWDRIRPLRKRAA